LALRASLRPTGEIMPAKKPGKTSKEEIEAEPLKKFSVKPAELPTYVDAIFPTG
jgi:hypothetical protein